MAAFFFHPMRAQNNDIPMTHRPRVIAYSDSVLSAGFASSLKEQGE